jgi:hypothetical protein
MDDKVIKWSLPVQYDLESGDYFINFPEDLLNAANLKEGDQVFWIDNNDGSFTIKKVKEDQPKTYQDMIADGFWIKEN